MKTNTKLLYPELSYTICGILFEVHNTLGRFCKESQYSNYFEFILKQRNIIFKKELSLGNSKNRIDFLIEDKIIIELKAKSTLLPQDYHQLKRYLQESKIKLGILVNLRSKYITPKRILNIYHS